MNKTIEVTPEQLGWLVNGVEVELDAKRSSLKQAMAPDERDMEERDIVELEALLKLLQEAK